MVRTKGIVIAGDYQQYRDWCKKNYCNLEEYKYVTKVEDIKAFKKISVHYIGQYWNNPIWGNPYLALIELTNDRK